MIRQNGMFWRYLCYNEAITLLFIGAVYMSIRAHNHLLPIAMGDIQDILLLLWQQGGKCFTATEYQDITYTTHKPCTCT